MLVKLFNFSKRKNSTLRPVGDYAEVDVLLKNTTSLDKPIIEIAGISFDYNYMVWDDKYYYITNVISVRNNLWELHCDLDVLATYKHNIQNTSAFVVYDTTANTEIPDSRIPMITTPTVQENSVRLSEKLYSEKGQAVLTVTGKDRCVSYSMFKEDAETILADIDSWFRNDSPDFKGEENGLESIFNMLKYGAQQTLSGSDAAGCIKSAIWIPWKIDDGIMENVMLGLYNSGKQGLRIKNRLTGGITSIKIPWQFSDWRNQSPYTEIYLFLPFVGLIHIPTGNMTSKLNPEIGVYYTLDITTGELSYWIFSGKICFGTYKANMSTPLMIGAVNWNLGNIVSSGVSAVGSILTKNIGGIVGAVESAISPIPQTVGGLGGSSSYDVQFLYLRCITVCHNTITDPTSVTDVMGTPAGSVKQLGGLTGYIQCENASINVNALESRIEELNSYLNGGFYLE